MSIATTGFAWNLAREGASLYATLGLAGQVILLAAAWLLPLVSEYDLVGDTISELALGRYGFLMTAALCLAGVGTIALVIALRPLTGGARGSLVGLVLVAIYGAGAVVSALFPGEPVRIAGGDVWSGGTIGTIRLLASLVTFPAMVVGMFILTRAFGLSPDLRSLTRWSVLLPTSALALLAQTTGPRAGLMQRLLVTAISIWLGVVAWRIRALASRPTVRGRPFLHSTPGDPSLTRRVSRAPESAA